MFDEKKITFLKDIENNLLDSLQTKTHNFTDHHILSFEKFTDIDCFKIIEENNPISVRVNKKDKNGKVIDGVQYRGELKFTSIEFKNPEEIINRDKKIYKQRIYPSQKKLLNETYSMSLYGNYNFSIYIDNVNNSEPKKIIDFHSDTPLKIGEIPVMLKSKYCNLKNMDKEMLASINENENERGGTFIVNGIKYITISQEYKTENMLYYNEEISKDEKKTVIYEIFIQSKNLYNHKYAYYNEVTFSKNNEILISISISKKVKKYVPMLIFLRALGAGSDKDIWNMIVSSSDSEEKQTKIMNILEKSFTHVINKKKNIHARDFRTMEDARIELLKIFVKSKTHKISKDDVKTGSEKYNMFFSKFLEDEYLPHIGGKDKLREKIIFTVTVMIRNLILLKLGELKKMDKNNYGGKRILTAGIIMGQVFKYVMHEVVKYIKNGIRSNIYKIYSSSDYKKLIPKIYNTDALIKELSKRISTGELPSGGSTTNINYGAKAGVWQNYEEKTLYKGLASTMKIVTSTKTKKTGDSTEDNISSKRRQLHQTQFGVLDPTDTSEGKMVGINKIMTLFSIITSQSNDMQIFDHINLLIKQNPNIGIYKLENTHKYDVNNYGKIFINGNFSYCILKEKTKIISNMLVESKRNGIINKYTSIEVYIKRFEIYIYTDAGRLLMPVLIVKNNKLNNMDATNYKKIKSGSMSITKLLNNQIIEYISINEAKNVLIAKSYDDLLFAQKNFRFYNYDYCIISPKMILGINTMSLPFPEKSNSPRNAFGANQIKQASAPPITNMSVFSEKKAPYLIVPQKTLTTTKGQQYIGEMKLPIGMTLTVAIISSNGKNLEDSICIDKSVVDRGLTNIIYNTFDIIQLENGNEIFGIPNPIKTFNYKTWVSYDKLDKNGWPIIGMEYTKKDVLVGKYKILTTKEKEKMGPSNKKYDYNDKSIVYKENFPSIVTHVIPIKKRGKSAIKIIMGSYNKLKIGDKVASACAQKSTISFIEPQENLPYDEEGNTPTLTMNITSFIKRRTISQIFVMAMGLLGIHDFEMQDVSGFNNIPTDYIINKLEEAGFNNQGTRIMYDGLSGEKLDAKIFVAPCPYWRLKQLAFTKKYVRSFKGPLNAITRQPMQGRARGGGLRFGEMERDVILAYGAQNVMYQLFNTNSDGGYEYFISENNNKICVGNQKKFIYGEGKHNRKISKTKAPWTFNLIVRLLESMNIRTDIIMEDDNIYKNVEIRKGKDRISIPILNRFEISTIVGSRMKQLKENVSPRIKDPILLEDMDFYDIGKYELMNGYLDDVIIERIISPTIREQWKVSELQKIE
jgi:DNA-directed RNA polymerase II subunit RPB2